MCVAPAHPLRGKRGWYGALSSFTASGLCTIVVPALLLTTLSLRAGFKKKKKAGKLKEQRELRTYPARKTGPECRWEQTSLAE